MTTPGPAPGSFWAAGWLGRLARISPRSAAIAAIVMAVPIGLLLAAIVFDVRPLGDALRAVLTVDGSQPSTLGRTYRLVGLIMLPVALGFAAWPMVRRQPDGRRHLSPFDLAVVGVVLLLVALTWGELAVEIVRCDVMGIPNCD